MKCWEQIRGEREVSTPVKSQRWLYTRCYTQFIALLLSLPSIDWGNVWEKQRNFSITEVKTCSWLFW